MFDCLPRRSLDVSIGDNALAIFEAVEATVLSDRIRFENPAQDFAQCSIFPEKHRPVLPDESPAHFSYHFERSVSDLVRSGRNCRNCRRPLLSSRSVGSEENSGQNAEATFDIGSRIDGFIAHLLVFMPVMVVDIRPLKSTVDGLTFVQDDATELADFRRGVSIPSPVSTQPSILGLGAIPTLSIPTRVLSLWRLGTGFSARRQALFLCALRPREMEFNAHRVFAPQTILESFPGLQLISFSAVGDDGDFYENADPAVVAGYELGCGLFEFTKANP